MPKSPTASEPKAEPHSFRGEIGRRRQLSGFILTELRHNQASMSTLHGHQTAYFSYLAGGSYLERAVRGEVAYQVGTTCFHPADYRHGDEIGTGGARFLCVELEQALRMSLRQLQHVTLRVAAPTSEVSRIAAAIHRELRSTDPGTDLVLEGLAFQLVGALVRLPVERQVPAWLRRVAERLREESHLPTRLADLAAEAGVHPAHLARAYRRHFHRTVGEELRCERVAAVRAALDRGETSLAGAAADAGFADQSHMSRVFRRVTGMSPAEYRRLVRREAELSTDHDAKPVRDPSRRPH